MQVTSHVWLFIYEDELDKIKYNLKFQFLSHTCQISSAQRHTWLVSTVSDSASVEHPTTAKFLLASTSLKA